MLRNKIALLGGAAFAAALAAPALAHHSFAKFDQRSVTVIEGEVVEVEWRNPHIRFKLSGTDASGAAVIWDIETHSPGILRRTGIEAGAVSMGDRVRISGNPAVDGTPELFANNMLLPDGRELQLSPDAPLRFSDQAAGDSAAWVVFEGDKSRPDLGIFRVWSSTFTSALVLFPDQGPPVPGSPPFTLMDYPFTDEVRATVQAFDPVEASRQIAGSCEPKGMPWVMEQPYDLAFEQEGDDIILKLEEFDTVRRIHMDWQGDRAAQASSILGFSTGVWEDGTLVVSTTNLNSPNFKFEISASEQMTIVERFTPAADGSQLDYEIAVTDPVTFTEPVVVRKHWLSVAGQVLDAYDCQAG